MSAGKVCFHALPAGVFLFAGNVPCLVVAFKAQNTFFIAYHDYDASIVTGSRHVGYRPRGGRYMS